MVELRVREFCVRIDVAHAIIFPVCYISNETTWNSSQQQTFNFFHIHILLQVPLFLKLKIMNTKSWNINTIDESI